MVKRSGKHFDRLLSLPFYQEILPSPPESILDGPTHSSILAQATGVPHLGLCTASSPVSLLHSSTITS